jgi:hypothetical protein
MNFSIHSSCWSYSDVWISVTFMIQWVVTVWFYCDFGAVIKCNINNGAFDQQMVLKQLYPITVINNYKNNTKIHYTLKSKFGPLTVMLLILANNSEWS